MFAISSERHMTHVLVVDDIALNMDVLEGILYKEGFGVVRALDGEEALKALGRDRIDLAILDVMMPGIDGYELCGLIKSMYEPKFFPVILVTALNGIEDKIKGIESGADDFISRPFHTIELITKIKSLLKLKKLQEELEHSENIIIALATTLEAKDPYTKGHSTRVSELAFRLALDIGLSGKEAQFIKKAGLLHDVGKIGVREAVLHKGAMLTDVELGAIRRHPIIGEEICRPLESLRPILPAIRHHHERWDGTGYPDALMHEDIPLYARMLAVVDTFDAIVSERPYRNPYRFEEALNVMQCGLESGQWDLYLTKRFIAMMRKEV